MGRGFTRYAVCDGVWQFPVSVGQSRRGVFNADHGRPGNRSFVPDVPETGNRYGGEGLSAPVQFTGSNGVYCGVYDGGRFGTVLFPVQLCNGIRGSFVFPQDEGGYGVPAGTAP